MQKIVGLFIIFATLFFLSLSTVKAGDFYVGYICNASYTVKHTCFPWDATYNTATKKCECPSGGCTQCSTVTTSSGTAPATNCNFPIDVTNLEPIKVTISNHYSSVGGYTVCGHNHSKNILFWTARGVTVSRNATLNLAGIGDGTVKDYYKFKFTPDTASDGTAVLKGQWSQKDLITTVHAASGGNSQIGQRDDYSFSGAGGYHSWWDIDHCATYEDDTCTLDTAAQTIPGEVRLPLKPGPIFFPDQYNAGDINNTTIATAPPTLSVEATSESTFSNPKIKVIITPRDGSDAIIKVLGGIESTEFHTFNQDYSYVLKSYIEPAQEPGFALEFYYCADSINATIIEGQLVEGSNTRQQIGCVLHKDLN
jgi:hypothetical protein